MISSLLSRLQSLTEPSREIDAEIAETVHPWLRDCPRADGDDGPGWLTKDGRVYAARYTESLDAVEPLLAEFYYLLAKGRTRPDEPLYGVQILRPDGNASDVIAEAEHEVAAIALLIAIMKAKKPAPEESKP